MNNLWIYDCVNDDANNDHDYQLAATLIATQNTCRKLFEVYALYKLLINQEIS